EASSSALLDGLHLVLSGQPIIPIPQHPRTPHAGYVSDEAKVDAIDAAEHASTAPHPESLSSVARGARPRARTRLPNAKCDVLRGQCLRSNGGLFYENFPEFFETLRAIDGNPALAQALGRNGRRYFETHSTWPVIEQKYIDMLTRLSREPAAATMEP